MVRRGFFQRLGALALMLVGGGFVVRAGEAKTAERLIILSFNGPSSSVGAAPDDDPSEEYLTQAPPLPERSE